MTYDLMTPSQAACKLTAEHISEGRVRAMHATAGIGLVQGPAHGTELSDLDGNSYIDCRSAGGVFNLGHARAEIAEVLSRAVLDTDMGDWMLLSGIRATTAQKLAAIAPDGLNYVQFGVTGSEAVEVACKLARGTTGRQTIITMENAYHGFSGFSLATAPAHITAPYGPLTPGIVQVPHGDLDAVVRTIDANTAAVLLETVQGSGGVILPPDGYLQGLRDLCDKHDLLLICDEVQAGMGRTGKMFSFEHWGIVPDMAVVGKALGGGYYPISACLYNARVLDFVNEHPLAHPSTFSGSEIGCLVAQKAIALLSAPELLANVSETGARLSEGYRRLQANFPELIQTHRQIGLFTGIDTTSPEVGTLLRHAAVRHGLIAFTAPFRPQFLQIWPPLIITADETDELLLRLTTALAETATQIQNTILTPAWPGPEEDKMDISKTLDGKITGGHMLARAMAEKGITKVFALCGGFINPIFIGCHDHGIEVIGCRNEMEAGFMAAAHARVTREPAICIAEPSGFTNYVSAVAEAFYAGDPVLFISASSNTHHFDNAGFKEMPQAEVVRSMTKYAIEVNAGERIGWFFDKAWDIATNSPTGPVQLAIPTNFLFSGAYASEPAPTARRIDPKRKKMHKPGPNPDDLAEFSALLAGAKKPVVIAGPGVWYSHSENAVGDFCVAHNIPIFQPVTHVKSFLPGHQVNMGLMDYHQNPCSRMIGAESDLVILLGGQLDFPLGFGEAPLFRRDQTIVAVNPTARELANVMNADVRICSDVGVLFHAVSAQKADVGAEAGWIKSIREARDASNAEYDAVLAESTGPIHPLRLCMDALNSLGEDDIIVIDGGDIAAWFEVSLNIWGAQGKKIKHLVNPGPWEQMGTGPAFATGVKMANPASKVILVTGDGSLGLAPGLTPLETSMDNDAPVTIVVANNGQWGMIQEQQKSMWGRVVATNLRAIDYAPIFEGSGAYGETVTKADDIAPAIHRSLTNNAKTSGLVDVKTKSIKSPITQGLVDMRIKTAIG